MTAETKDGGLRSVCDLALSEVPVLDQVRTNPIDLEPGDVIFCRTSANPLSRLISRLDGYWCHTALYVGDGEVVHAGAPGIVCESVAALEQDYEDGLAFARLKFEPAQRAAAATWARTLVQDPEVRRYSGRDLGVAFSLLMRARARARLSVLAELPEPDAQSIESDLRQVGEPFKRIESTCAGFVYRAYRTGIELELEIVTAPGIRQNDGWLSYPAEQDLAYEAALLHETGGAIDAGPDATLVPLVEGAKDLTKMIRILGGAARGIISMLPASTSVPLDQGVTPADLWCSPSIAQRRFLTSEARQAALQASAHCGAPQT